MRRQSERIGRTIPGRSRAWLARLVLVVALTAAPGFVVWPAASATAAPEQGTPAAEHAAASTAEHAAEGEHGESIWSFLSRIGNFLIFAGGLYYLLRSPIGRYLDARSLQIRSDLQEAAQTRTEASARLTTIEARMRALPGEIDAMKARGKEEIAAEEARIRQAADAERHRLVEQTRREIDRQLQIARRELTEHAADLAIGVARARLSGGLSDEQQLRLVDRYVEQVRTGHE